MGRLSIYEYKDYKQFLLEWMDRAPNKGRGQRRLLADAIGCQTPFVTHVLNGDYHFSLEQAEACSRWLGLGDAEAEFFVLLVIKHRAGTRGLEKLAERQISSRRESSTILKKRLNIREEMSLENQNTYYGSWYYSAIHMACLNPELQSTEALQKQFGLPLHQLLQALEFLMEHQLIEKTKSGFRALRPVLHLGKDSPLLVQHHMQWRIKAIDAIQRKDSSNLFYSGVASLSNEDYEWMRERLTQLLEDVFHRVKDSKDETLACLNFDLFKI